jgi:2-methylcitrate dehydratase
MIDLIVKYPELLKDSRGENIREIRILAYEPAFGIIGNPAKMDPKTRQSADHSMAYIVATLLRKALQSKPIAGAKNMSDALWKSLMLSPYDYKEDESAIFHPMTRALMKKIKFEHGGAEYDKNYPDGIPTSLVITSNDGKNYDSGFVMYPAGHARNTTADLRDILATKFAMLGDLALKNPKPVIDRFNNLAQLGVKELATLHDFELLERGGF